MTATHPRPLLFLAVVLLLTAFTTVACTRERPTPEPTATSAAPVSVTTLPTPAPQETPAPRGGSEADLVITNTPAPSPTEPVGGPPFLYTVREGDTLSGIAARFGTDMATLTQLNNLVGDQIQVGQPLYIPFVEGITAEGVPTPTPGPFQYTVQPGDTLSGIGTRYGVDPIRIIEANNLLNPDTLTVGVQILIPGYQPPAESAAGGSTPRAVSPGDQVIHTVQAGEGLIGIAAAYGVNVEDIVSANGIVDRNNLRIGQQLIIPGISARDLAAARSITHVVAAGETLLSIAIRYGVTVDEIIALNELNNPNAIFIGQRLLIPGN